MAHDLSLSRYPKIRQCSHIYLLKDITKENKQQNPRRIIQSELYKCSESVLPSRSIQICVLQPIYPLPSSFGVNSTLYQDRIGFDLEQISISLQHANKTLSRQGSFWLVDCVLPLISCATTSNPWIMIQIDAPQIQEDDMWLPLEIRIGFDCMRGVMVQLGILSPTRTPCTTGLLPYIQEEMHEFSCY